MIAVSALIGLSALLIRMTRIGASTRYMQARRRGFKTIAMMPRNDMVYERVA